MMLSVIGRHLLRATTELIERNIFPVAATNCTVIWNHYVLHACPITTGQWSCTSQTKPLYQLYRKDNDNFANNIKRASQLAAKKTKIAKEQLQYNKADSDADSDNDSDNEDLEQNNKHYGQNNQRGDSEFWRRKMRTLHRILDVNRDGVVSFDDFNLLAKRFTNLGHLSPELSNEFLDILKQTWEEQFGAITPYNLITAEQFLVDLHHRLNDKEMSKRVGRFLPYLFKAVDYDHTGYLDLEQYKLFFQCLGLSDEDAAISFAAIDKNGDGLLSLKEFVYLGRQYFLNEDENKISKMFWGPLIDH